MSKQNVSVVVVEDDVALNDAYTMILESAGHIVHRAFNGEEALQVIKTLPTPPAVILLDLRMPVLDGLGFLKKYEPELHPETVVVVFSNYDAKGDIDEAYSLGAHRYVLKARAAPKELLHLVDSIVYEQQGA